MTCEKNHAKNWQNAKDIFMRNRLVSAAHGLQVPVAHSLAVMGNWLKN